MGKIQSPNDEPERRREYLGWNDRRDNEPKLRSLRKKWTFEQREKELRRKYAGNKKCNRRSPRRTNGGTTGEIIAESERTYTDVSRPIAAKLALDKAYELARDNGFEQVGRVITTEPIY